MPSPRNTTLSAERLIQVALDLLDQRKEHLCSIVESEQTSPDEKYEALVSLAYMTGILVREAAEAEAAIHPSTVATSRSSCVSGGLT
jgi:hypothetical protein